MRLIGNLDHALSMLKNGKDAISNTPAQPSIQNVQKSAPTYVSPGRKLASGGIVYNKTNLPNTSYRVAQSNTIFTQPQFYSPLHNPQNLQIPSKRREIYQWVLINPCYITSYDHTLKPIEEFDFIPSERIIDTFSNEEVFEIKECEEILSSSGIFRKPCRISSKKCINKESVEFKAWGYWRSLHVTEDHRQIWLDGDLYRKKKKLDDNEKYRRKLGIPKGKNKHLAHNENTLIKKGYASEVKQKDYLLFPVSPVGENVIPKDDAWMIGNCVADGTIGHYGTCYSVRYTVDKNEQTRFVLEDVLSKKFSSKISSKPHGEGNGWRVSVTTKESFEFFSEYIHGIKTNKKLKRSVFDLDKKSRLNLLGGYIDGDGCFQKNGTIAITCYSKDLADQIYSLTLSVGIRCSLARNPVLENTFHTDSKWYYKILIPNADVSKISPFMRSKKVPSNFEPKKERLLRFFHKENDVLYIAQPIEYIKKYIYNGIGYDLEIKPEHAFVANGIVTSNCRFFAENEPKVAAAIDFYSKFPMNGFELQCDDPKIKRFFENFNKKIKLEHWCKMISREYFMLGDVFPFMEIECDICQGSGRDEDGDKCIHPHGSFRRLVVLNPDWVDVQTNVLAEDPVITLLPDDELKRIVWHKQPKAIYDRIPANVRNLILAGRPIPLDNNAVSHLKFNPYPYGTYGQSLIRRLFKILAYKDKLMTAQWMVAERLILPVRIVKVGNDERPAGPVEISDVQQQLAQVANDPNLTLVTHHAFDYEWIGTNGKVLQLNQEYELVNKEILQGLMINEALLSGEMGGYASAAIGAEAIKHRMDEWRRELKLWIEERIYKPIAQMKGFLDEEATREIGQELGEPIYIYPKVKWNELHIRDQTQHDQILLQLQERGLVSTDTVLTELGFDYDDEVEKLRYETASQSFGAMGEEGGGGGMGGGGGGMGGGMDMGGGGAPGTGLEGPMGAEMSGALGGGMDVGAPPPGGGAAAASVNPIGGSQGKILSKSRAGKQAQPEEEVVQPSRIRLTSLEQKMNRMLQGMRLPFRYMAQYPLGPYRTDFAIPSLKLAVEVDGAKWHNNPEALAKDKSRDADLALEGWTVARFGESELGDKSKDVEYTLTTVINDLWRKALTRQQQMREAKEKAAIDSSSLVKIAIAEKVLRTHLENNEKTAEIKKSSSSLVGTILESYCDKLVSDNLKVYAKECVYPYERRIIKREARESDGNTD